MVYKHMVLLLLSIVQTRHAFSKYGFICFVAFGGCPISTDLLLCGFDCQGHVSYVLTNTVETNKTIQFVIIDSLFMKPV